MLMLVAHDRCKHRLLDEFHCVVVPATREESDGHYLQFCKQTLWPLMHSSVPDYLRSVWSVHSLRMPSSKGIDLSQARRAEGAQHGRHVLANVPAGQPPFRRHRGAPLPARRPG